MTNDTITPRRRGRPPKQPAITSAPVRRRRAPAGAALEGEIVGKAETVTAAAEDKRPHITWRGRRMPVKMPTGDQLAVVLDTYDALARLSEQDATQADQSNSRAGRLLARALKGTLLVLDDPDDKDWIKDRMLDGDITLNDVAGLLPEAIAAVNPTRPAPTTGPPAKARRKA